MNIKDNQRKIITWTILITIAIGIFEGYESFSDFIGTAIGALILVILVRNFFPQDENKYQDTEDVKIKQKKESQPEDIKKLYRDLQKKYHPDLARSEEDKKLRTDIIVKINNAYSEGNIDVLKIFK